MARTDRVFYAFPGRPAALGETINATLDALKNHPDIKKDRVRFTPWNELTIGGNNLIGSILESIDRADVFVCDLTYPNLNVSFELGYAIGRFKRVWVSLDTSIEESEHRFRRTYYNLLGSGYVPYHNSPQLVEAFLNERPYQTLDKTLLGESYRRQIGRQEEPVILYMQPPILTDSVIATKEVLQRSVFASSLVLDDPIENPSPTLEWYAGKLNLADAVLCHLLGNHQVGQLDHNVTCALVSGLSQGFRKSMLMLVQRPFQSPVDYRGLLDLHDTAGECKLAVQKWTDQLSETIPRRRPRRPDSRASSQDNLDLRSLAIGEPVAENERHQIDDYFVETGTFFRALDDPVSIVVGRKGVGKSAQLFAMQAALAADPRNHVCIVKPVGYEIDGLVRVLRSIVNKSERGYLIESLWKFLIYSEIAQSFYHAIQSRPAYLSVSDPDSRLLHYYDSHKVLLDPPFSERLDIALRGLDTIGETEDALNQRTRISELLHTNQLRDLRDILGEVLSKYEKVSILIDNLDAPWGTNVNIDPLSELLWGLLQVLGDIVSEFRINDYWRASANVLLTVFLRSDIFAFIQPTAPEQDKLPVQRIIWDDPEVLKRLIDHRLEFGSQATTDASDIWRQLFPKEVVGIDAWDFVMNTVLPRPRDVVYLMREAIDGAINRGHYAVTEQDFLDARDKYSEYAFRSVQAEDNPHKGMLESIMYEFAGCPKEITRSQIDARFGSAGVNSEDFDFYIDLLCDVNFLAIPTRSGYQYAKHEADRQVRRRVAAQVAKNKNQEESYQVSSAFWQVLQIEQAAGGFLC